MAGLAVSKAFQDRLTKNLKIYDEKSVWLDTMRGGERQNAEFRFTA
jgi:hypothetical protein